MSIFNRKDNLTAHLKKHHDLAKEESEVRDREREREGAFAMCVCVRVCRVRVCESWGAVVSREEGGWAGFPFVI